MYVFISLRLKRALTMTTDTPTTAAQEGLEETKTATPPRKSSAASNGMCSATMSHLLLLYLSGHIIITLVILLHNKRSPIHYGI